MLTADYTRKTQKLAEDRKAMESDLEFLETIRTDPEAALEFHQGLTKALIDAGLTPAQAAAVADEQVAEPEVDFGTAYGDDPDAALKAEVTELKKWRAEQEATRAQEDQDRADMAELQRTEGELTRQEMAIRQSNETYDDDDINSIYELAFSYGGNLVAAQEAYEELRNRFVTSYVDKKSGHEAVGEPVVGGASATPKKFDSVEEAHEAAQIALRNYLAAQ